MIEAVYVFIYACMPSPKMCVASARESARERGRQRQREREPQGRGDETGKRGFIK